MKCSPDKKIVIAVDGFSSCGKSTFAKKIASALGYVFIDTGAMYRAVTLYGIRHGAIRGGVVDAEALERMLPRIGISFVFNPRGKPATFTSTARTSRGRSGASRSARPSAA